MSSDQKFPDDDKTRIGVGVNFSSPTEKNNQPPKDSAPSFEDDKTRIGPGINFPQQTPPPQRQSAPEPTPHFDDGKTRIVGVPPGQSAAPPVPLQSEADMLFIAELPTGALEFPLVSGRRMTVGRENGQDIVVNDRTLSRNHLLLERKGDSVSIQIIGLNGLVHNGVTHKSTTIDIAAPSSFTIGKISCRLQKKVDTDATLFMADPAQFADKAGSEPPPPPPFPGPSIKSSDFPGQSASSDAYKAPPSPFPPPDFESSAESDQSHIDSSVFSSNQSGSPFEDFDGQSSWNDPFASAKQTKSNFFSQLSPLVKYGIIGGVLLFVIILAIILLKGDDEPEPTTFQAPQTVPVSPPPLIQHEPATQQSAPVQQPDTKNYNLHGRYFNEAYRYYNEGNYVMSCDYLKDIPRNSAFRERAENLALQMGNCKLDD